jgi:antitoxin component YwqK of YwqJK toxin-antitoxin module
METVNLNQLTRAGDGSIYLFNDVPFSGFAIETFPDGKLQTQMTLMLGLQDGVTRRWHDNGQLESEQTFRNGKPLGWHRKW